MTVFAHLYDKNQAYITLASSKGGNLSLEKAVAAGTYYLRLSDSFAHGVQIYEMVIRVK